MSLRIRVPLLFFIGAVFCSLFITGFVPLLMLLIVGSVVTIFKRMVFILPFLLFGYILPMLHSTENIYDFDALPQKGFVELTLSCSDFPKYRSDNRYEIQSDNIRIIADDISPLYKSVRVQLKGRLEKYRFGDREYASLYPIHYTIIEEGFWFYFLISRMRLFAASRIETLQNTEIKALLYAMLLGNTLHLDYTSKQSFRMTGLSHLLAISGMHIGIVGFAVLLLLKGRLKLKTAHILAMVVVLFYVGLSGFTPSSLRAGTMFILYSLFKIAGLKIEPLDIVLLSCLPVLSIDPLVMRNPGFWLSYSAVLGILFFKEVFAVRFNVFPQLLRDSLAITLSANLATLPLLLFFFQGVGILSPIANLLVVPVFPILIVMLFILFVASLPAIPIMTLPLEVLVVPLWTYVKSVAETLSYLHFTYITWEGFDWIMLWLSYFVIAGLLSTYKVLSIKRIQNITANRQEEK